MFARDLHQIKKASIVDARFKLQKKISRSILKTVSPRTRTLSLSKADHSPSELLGLYKNVLSSSMYSKCRWFPSDSQYMILASSKCGVPSGVLMSVGRLLAENDASNMVNGYINDQNYIRYVDFKMRCPFANSDAKSSKK